MIHALPTLLGQRIIALALGYEDVNDPRTLRRDPVLALFSDRLEPKRKDCAPLAGKSTVNRLEHAPRDGGDRYHKIGHDAKALERVFADIFLDAHGTPPEEIVLDLDATDDPLHRYQEGQFFHGYYGCYCYLPLYVFCGRHLLAAKLRRALLVEAGEHVAFGCDVDAGEHIPSLRRQRPGASEPAIMLTLVQARTQAGKAWPQDTVRALNAGRGRQSHRRGQSLERHAATLSQQPVRNLSRGASR